MLKLYELYKLLGSAEKRRAILLLFLVLIMAVLDVLGVASILPFIAVLSDPSIINRSSILSTIYAYSGSQSEINFLFLLGLMTFFTLCISMIFKAFTTYYQFRFILYLESYLGTRLISLYLHQKYLWLTERHSAELGKNILSEVGSVIANGVMPAGILMSQTAVATALIIFLLFINPILAITIFSSLGFVYLFIYIFLSGFISKAGSERFKINEQRFRISNEAFNAAKEVKFFQLETNYSKKFSELAARYAQLQAYAAISAQIPRFALELIAFGGLILLVLIFIGQNANLSTILPLITLYAFAGYRLMPALQQIYNSATLIRFAGDPVNEIIKHLSKLKIEEIENATIKKANFEHAISFSEVSFKYPNASKSALDKISFTIPKGLKIGVVGHTGSGKTTMVDILLGLIEPTAGKVCVDEKPLDHVNYKSFQQIIGYVPQNVYLNDMSVAQNIAIGVQEEKIDYKILQKAAKAACIHNTIIQNFENCYYDSIGERGSRLSGGECQRLGIARALYRQPELLVLDEATSALDNITEANVIDAITNYDKSMTTIMIAHRLSSLKHCDMILVFENGKIVEQGTFDELAGKKTTFRSMIKGEYLKSDKPT